MKNIQLFENFGSGETPEFTADIKKDHVSFDLYGEPGDLRRGYVREGRIHWTAEVYYKSWGIELESCIIKDMWFTIELEDEEGEPFEKEIVIPANTLSAEQFSKDVYEFPLVLTAVEIEMRHSEDPQDWKIKLTLGHIES